MCGHAASLAGAFKPRASTAPAIRDGPIADSIAACTVAAPRHDGVGVGEIDDRERRRVEHDVSRIEPRGDVHAVPRQSGGDASELERRRLIDDCPGRRRYEQNVRAGDDRHGIHSAKRQRDEREVGIDARETGASTVGPRRGAGVDAARRRIRGHRQ